METNNRAEAYERFSINRIYETSNAVAAKLRRMADDIDDEVERAKDNEKHANLTRATSYISLPAQVVAIVTSGVANAQLDGPARQLRELLLSREAQRVIDDRTAEQEKTGECQGCGRMDGQHKMGCSLRPGRGAIFTATRDEDGTFTAETEL